MATGSKASHKAEIEKVRGLFVLLQRYLTDVLSHSTWTRPSVTSKVVSKVAFTCIFTRPQTLLQGNENISYAILSDHNIRLA